MHGREPPTDGELAATPSAGLEPGPAAVHVPVDENAPRLEVKASPYVDAVNAYKVSMTLTVTNVGHRPALAAIRPRMAAFRVEGPDGSSTATPRRRRRGLPRSAYQTLKPGASAVITLLVQEACANDLFRRPGLYQVSPSLHLNEDGSEAGLAAMTGVLTRRTRRWCASRRGRNPFAKKPPEAARAPPPAPSVGDPVCPPADGDAHDGS